ncbi:MAG: zinc protease [Arenicella sp.]|jgi:zinc protease
MIKYEKFTLDNGLQVVVHEDDTVATVAVNILYNVGSKDEEEEKTGFAHLFEHLMFGGSKNIPNYDSPLQRVGGQNNAFTSPDITNYYVTLPTENIETAFWLESDRMMSLSFDPEVLEVQRKVVIEEFKQRYLDQPYGDVWLKLRPLAYKVHPYKWATIGKNIQHIEDVTMEDVKAFFKKFYNPSNAIMVVAGNIKTKEVQVLVEKWFAEIPKGEPYHRNLPEEPKQTEARFLEMEADVPVDILYKVYHTVDKVCPKMSATDLLSDILGRGKTSRLYSKLVRENQIFNSLDAYITGSIENGLLIIAGKPSKGVSLEKANEALEIELEAFKNELIEEEELEKVKNQAESTLAFSEIEILNRAMALAFATLLGDTEMVNQESEKIQAVTAKEIQEIAKEVLAKENSSTLFYKAKGKS